LGVAVSLFLGVVVLCAWVPAVMPRVVEGRACGLPVMLPGGAVEARGSRVPRERHRSATPKAPLTWEGRPRRLRGITAGTHAHNIGVSATPALGGGALFRAGKGVCSWGLS
jgi:hypothetical protein